MVRLEVKGIEMALSKGANTYNRQNWEESEFPLLCQTCLGDNPYVRMMKEKHGKDCKTCAEPFTVFRWCPGARMRFKKTEICQTCSQKQNICQTCLLDLEYGLPVQVRDAALRVQDSLPKSDVNKEYYMSAIEKEIESGDGTNPVGAIASKSTSPYYKRNRPHICSFWVKGECRRGEECPYRHNKPTDPEDPLADQNIRDRFYGSNDPVADKLLRRYHDMPKLEPPEDKTITTLYVGGLGENKINEDDLKYHFYQFGEIRSIIVVPKQQCGFVQFTNRANAESAAERSFSRLIIKGQRLHVQWGRSQGNQQSTKKDENDEEDMSETPSWQTVAPPRPPKDIGDMRQNYFNLPPQMPPPPFMWGGRMPMEPPPFAMDLNAKPSGPPSYPSGSGSCTTKAAPQPAVRFQQPSNPFCPDRYKKPTDSDCPLDQNICDRVYCTNDEVDDKSSQHDHDVPKPEALLGLSEGTKQAAPQPALRFQQPSNPFCPDRCKKPTDSDCPLDQNICDRVYSTNDEVVDKSPRHDHDMPKPEAFLGLSKALPIPFEDIERNYINLPPMLPPVIPKGVMKMDVPPPPQRFHRRSRPPSNRLHRRFRQPSCPHRGIRRLSYSSRLSGSSREKTPKQVNIQLRNNEIVVLGNNNRVCVNKYINCSGKENIADYRQHGCIKDRVTFFGNNNSLVENYVIMVDMFLQNEEMSNDEDTEELWDND